jgi:dTDP-glucose pyrophosphorylase
MRLTNVHGVILAAGRGSRIAPLSDAMPKPLLPICNKPVMQYQIEALRDAGITDVVIVTGYKEEAIRATFGDGSSLGVDITYMTDPDPCGIASSLLCAEQHAGQMFVLFLGDIFFAVDNLPDIVHSLVMHDAEQIVVSTRENDVEAIRRNFAVMCGDDLRISRLVEKPEHPQSDLKGCGLYVFRPSIFNAIRRTPRSTLRNEYELTHAMQVLIDDGAPAYAHELAGWEVNLTYPEQLIETNSRLLGEMDCGSLIGARAELHPGVRVRRSVIGCDAAIASPVTFDECVVLPGTRIGGAARRFHRTIIGPNLELAVDGGGVTLETGVLA